MQVDLKLAWMKKPAIVLLVLAGLGALGWALGYSLGVNDNGAKLVAFLADLPVFVVQIIALTILLLPFEWALKWLVSREWYDKGGAAVEMGTVRGRIGTEEERVNDPIACAIQLGAVWLFRAIWYYAALMFLHP